MAGSYPDAAELAYDAFEIMQPGIDRALSDLATELYAGKWVAVHSIQNATEASSAIITVEGGTLYIDEYVLFGVDALEKMEAKGRVALRPTRRDEFRCVIMFLSSSISDSPLMSIPSAWISAYQVIAGNGTPPAFRTGLGRITGECATTLR